MNAQSHMLGHYKNFLWKVQEKVQRFSGVRSKFGVLIFQVVFIFRVLPLSNTMVPHHLRTRMWTKPLNELTGTYRQTFRLNHLLSQADALTKISNKKTDRQADRQIDRQKVRQRERGVYKKHVWELKFGINDRWVICLLIKYHIRVL